MLTWPFFFFFFFFFGAKLARSPFAQNSQHSPDFNETLFHSYSQTQNPTMTSFPNLFFTNFGNAVFFFTKRPFKSQISTMFSTFLIFPPIFVFIHNIIFLVYNPIPISTSFFFFFSPIFLLFMLSFSIVCYFNVFLIMGFFFFLIILGICWLCWRS